MQPVQDEFLRARGVTLSVLRLDLIHPYISGNKWFKLQPHLEQARQLGRHGVLSFGGAYSNHLLALAAAGREFGFATIGMVRGELVRPLNPVLQAAESFGMHLVPLDRTAYRSKSAPAVVDALAAQWGNACVVPEGGASLLGVRGSMAIAQALRWQTGSGALRLVTLACATGTTLAGLVAGLPAGVRVDATLVLRGEDCVSGQVRDWLAQLAVDAPERTVGSWQVLGGWHCGGYARSTPALLAFMEAFTARTGIPLDPVYTGKMLWSLYQRIEGGDIPVGTEVIAIHTGGIFPRAD